MFVDKVDLRLCISAHQTLATDDCMELAELIQNRDILWNEVFISPYKI